MKEHCLQILYDFWCSICFGNIKELQIYQQYLCLVLVTMAESLRNKVDEHLTCSVCLKSFKDPKVLPCLHTFCHGCIVNLAKNARSDTINCPECRLAVKVRALGLGQGLEMHPHDP